MLSSLSSPHTPTREAAEQQYQALLARDPTSLAQELCRQAHPDLVGGNKNNKDTTLALVLLRQLVKGPQYQHVQPMTRAEICDFLMDVVDRHGVEAIKIKAAEVLVVMPTQDLHEELLTRCISLVRRKDDVVVRAGLYVLDGLGEFAYEDIVSKRAAKLAEVVMMRLDPATTPILTCLVALRTACSLVIGSPITENDATASSSSSPPLDPAFQTLGEVLPCKAIEMVAIALQQQNLVAECEKTLQSLALLTESRASLLDRELGRFCGLLLQACESPSTPSGIKTLCLANLSSVLARRGATAVTDTEFCTRALRTIMYCVVSDNEFASQHDAFSAPSEDDPLELQRGGTRGAALDALQAFAAAVSIDQTASKTLLGHIFELIKVMFQSQSWIERHAAFSTIAAVSVPLEKRMWAHLQDVVQACCRVQETDVEARVRAAASGCMSCLFKFCPAIGMGMRKSMHGIVIPSLVRSLATNEARDTAYSRCALLVCVQLFLQGPAPRESVAAYVDSLTMTLVSCLKSNQTCVQVKALESLANLATAVGPDFGRFYNDLIPSIKQVLAFLNADSELAKAAMTCVAAVAECAGKERFARDATELLESILGRAHSKMALHGDLAKNETLELEGLFEFVHRVCVVLGPDFAPFVGHVLPLTLHAAQADLGVQISDAIEQKQQDENVEEDGDDEEENGGHMSTTIRSRGIGALNVSANVFAFQVRASAIKAIDSMADALGDKFTPDDLEKCCQVVLDNVQNRLATAQINSKAAEAMGSLFHAACKMAQKNPVEFVPYVRSLFVESATKLLYRLGEDTSVSEEATERRLALISAFERCTRACYFSGDLRDEGGEKNAPIVTPPPELYPKLVDALLEIFKKSLQRRDNEMKDLRNKGYDGRTIKQCMEFLEDEEQEFCEEIVDSLGFLFKSDVNNMWPSFEGQILPFFSTFLASGDVAHKGLEHAALCMFVDAVEYCPIRERVPAIKIDETVLERILQQRAHDAKMVQLAAYGLGVYAMRGVLVNVQVAATSLVTMLRAVPTTVNEGNGDASMDDWMMAKDNLVSSLAKATIITSTGGDMRNDAITLWLSNLPLVTDESEAQFNHDLLCQLVLQKEPIVMSTPQIRAHVVKILAMCVKPFTANYSDESQVDIAGNRVRTVMAPQAIEVMKHVCEATGEWQSLVGSL